MPNDARPEPGVPSAGASCDNMMAKSEHIKTQRRCLNKTVINKDAKKKKMIIL